MQELAGTLGAPASSVYRELGRAEDSGIVLRDASGRPHRFRAATEDSFYEPLALLLRRSVGVEEALQALLADRADVLAAVIYGSWSSDSRRPDSDVDLLVVGDAELRDLRKQLRPIAKSVGRTFDLTVLAPDEFRRLVQNRSSFAQRILRAPTIPLVGDLVSIAAR